MRSIVGVFWLIRVEICNTFHRIPRDYVEIMDVRNEEVVLERWEEEEEEEPEEVVVVTGCWWWWRQGGGAWPKAWTLEDGGNLDDSFPPLQRAVRAASSPRPEADSDWAGRRRRHCRPGGRASTQ
jgi:hypothetical protein